MPSRIVESIAKKLGDKEPPSSLSKLASVAVMLEDDGDPKTLLIRRAEKEEDPWSGQIAFPGGKRMEGDSSLRDTAVREAWEEVGVDLSKSAHFLGYFGSFRTHTGTMDVVPAVFLLRERVQPVPNDEVKSFRWVSLNGVLDPASRTLYRPKDYATAGGVPAFSMGDYVVWGLTYRIVSALLEDT
jgi:8-oxo-dGTP pyrophosphatase MutT (NUDIX family)